MLYEKIDKVEDILNKHQAIITYLEKQNKKRNIIVIGLAEVESNNSDLLTNTINTINKKLQLNINTNEVEDTCLLGQAFKQKMRPILVA